MQSNETLPPKSAAARTDLACGPYGCLKKGNNTDVFPTIDNLTMGCGASNCGIPVQRFLDQGMPDIAYQPYMKLIKERADPDDVVMVPAPSTAPGYRFYEDKPFSPTGLQAGNAYTVKGYGNFKPRGWNMPDAYSGRYTAKGTGAAKEPSDFEAWQRGTSFPSRRYPLGHLPIRDVNLAQEQAQGDGKGTAWWKWALGIGIPVLLIGGGVALYYGMRKKPTKPTARRVTGLGGVAEDF